MTIDADYTIGDVHFIERDHGTEIVMSGVWEWGALMEGPLMLRMSPERARAVRAGIDRWLGRERSEQEQRMDEFISRKQQSRLVRTEMLRRIGRAIDDALLYTTDAYEYDTAGIEREIDDAKRLLDALVAGFRAAGGERAAMRIKMRYSPRNDVWYPPGAPIDDLVDWAPAQDNVRWNPPWPPRDSDRLVIEREDFEPYDAPPDTPTLVRYRIAIERDNQRY